MDYLMNRGNMLNDQKQSITCQLTGIVGRPVKAHIIPKAFYLIRDEYVGKMKLVSSSHESHVKRCPAGVYDEAILVKEGESRFCNWDNYAYGLLVTQFHNFQKIKKNGVPRAYQFSDYDYKALKLFFLSVLWRAGVSSRPYFQQVKLGVFEVALRQAILNSNPGNAEFHSVVLAVFDDHMEYPKMVDPRPVVISGVNFFRFNIGNIVATIKADENMTPLPLSCIQLKPASPPLNVIL
jgi:hypothetical protein